LQIGDLEVMPIQVMHGKLPILGYRIGKLTYITDMKTIDDGELKYIEGTELLVVNALRFDKPHHSHQLMDDAIAFARKVGAKNTLIIHVCHDVGLHEEVNRILPEGIQLAYDGQEIYL
jgi:phosphoribosyl 1,2-cyclic phosphate phosphodiesterase